MPVEVRELVIKATVANENNTKAAAQGQASGNNSAPGEEMIRACVEKVLEILKEKHER
jgi:hypothetical protein